MTTSSGTVNQLDTVRIGINGRVLKYRSIAQLSGITVGALVEYEADTEGVWLESIRRVDGETSEPPKQDAKAILQENIKAKQEEKKPEPVKPPVAPPECLDVITPGVDDTIAQMGKPVEQVIIHKHEGEKARPDSIEFSGTSKKAGLKVYFDAGDPAEALERVEQAFVIYDHAVREMQKRQGEA